MKHFYLVMALGLPVLSMPTPGQVYARFDGTTDARSQQVLPTAGVWEGAADFGTLAFTVNSAGTALIEVAYQFDSWTCGPTTVSGGVTFGSSGWSITNNEFTVTNTLDPGGNQTMMIGGTFSQAGDELSGDWVANSYGTECSGTWQAVPALLPVELANFTVSVDGTGVVLRWVTVSEYNNSGFEVQHFTATWKALAFVEGRGTTSQPESYEYRIEALDPGFHTFRLKQIDLDGSFTYSHEIEVEIGVPQKFALHAAYPNPFNPSATIFYELPRRAEVRLHVYNVLCQHIVTLVDGEMEAGRHRAVFEAGSLSSGVYFLRMEAGPFMETKSMILAK